MFTRRYALVILLFFSITHAIKLHVSSLALNKALQLIESKLVNWLRALVRMLPNLLLAAIVIVIGIYRSKLIRNFSRKMLDASHTDGLLQIF